MALLGEPYSKITETVGMHKSSITIWKPKFLAKGLDGIKLGSSRLFQLFDFRSTGRNDQDVAK